MIETQCYRPLSCVRQIPQPFKALLFLILFHSSHSWLHEFLYPNRSIFFGLQVNESENPQLGRSVESLVAKMKSRGIAYRQDYIYVASVCAFLGEKIFQGGSLVLRTLAHFNIQDPAFWVSEAEVRGEGWPLSLALQVSTLLPSRRSCALFSREF